MLVLEDQVRREGAMSAAIRQRSARTREPQASLGRTPYQVAERQPSAPLSFPSPTFGSCRRITEPIAQGRRPRGTGYTLVSGQTGRSWLVIDSIRNCQFGEVLRGVELVRTPSGRWAMPTGAPSYVAIKASSRDVFVWLQLCGDRKMQDSRIVDSQCAHCAEERSTWREFT